jgi:hypothetical protein
MVVPVPRPTNTAPARALLNLTVGVLSLAVGVPLVVLGLSLLTGSLEAAAQLLFFSVICTLGIGGLFWLGLAFGVGFLTLHLVGLLLPGVGKGAATGSADRRQRESETVALYVSRRLQQGGDLTLIRRDLRQAGWDTSQIDAAVAAASGAGADR